MTIKRLFTIDEAENVEEANNTSIFQYLYEGARDMINWFFSPAEEDTPEVEEAVIIEDNTAHNSEIACVGATGGRMRVFIDAEEIEGDRTNSYITISLQVYNEWHKNEGMMGKASQHYWFDDF